MRLRKNDRVPVMIGVHEMKARVLHWIDSGSRWLVLVKIGFQYFVLVNPIWHIGHAPEAHPIPNDKVEAALQAA